jgi:hypothetical protein
MIAAPTPTVILDVADADELVELMQLIDDSLRVDYHRHRASLDDLIGHDLDALRDNLPRFRFLLAGDDDLIHGAQR